VQDAIARKVAARFIAASREELLAKKDTGNYRVRLLDDGETPSLKVMYTGRWAGGYEVDVDLEPDSDYEIEDITKWFTSTIRGDHDVEELLLEAGYDADTNPVGRSKPVVVRI